MAAVMVVKLYNRVQTQEKNPGFDIAQKGEAQITQDA